MSDQWVSGFVGNALAAAGARGIAGDAWLRLRDAARAGSWAYNDRVPADADSTIWACRLGESLGDRSGVIDGGLRFLARCRRANGGFATYPAQDEISSALPFGPHLQFQGWCSAHVCVSGAAAGLATLRSCPRLRRFLLATQETAGYWSGYWWCDPEYATALACEALAGSQCAEELGALRRAQRWARARGHDGTPFALACRIRVLAAVSDNRRARALASCLLSLQNSDGSWPASACIRIPPPELESPQYYWAWSEEEKGIGSIRVDEARLFTTASVLSALTHVL